MSNFEKGIAALQGFPIAQQRLDQIYFKRTTEDAEAQRKQIYP